MDETRSADGVPPAPETRNAGAGAGDAPAADEPAPGVGEAIAEARAAFMRMLEAHLALLRAELAVVGQELGIIVGLAAGALVLLLVALLLLYIGGWLFFGDWLFGSMGWGIIHGTLLNVAIIGLIAVNLAGGSQRGYFVGLFVGVVVGLAVGVVLSFNIGNDLAEWGADLFEAPQSLDENWVPTLLGLIVGVVVTGAVALTIGWWKRLRGRPLLWTVLAAAAAGGFAGALVASTRYDNPDGVGGLAIMLGLLTWIIVGALLAYWQGFDPEARYEGLIPRRSIESLEVSRDFLKAQLKRQKDRMMGR